MSGFAPLQLNILSDLHLSRGGLPLPDTSADVIVLAGDIARPKEAVDWALGFTKPVLYIAGNHEFYGSGIRETLQDLRQRCVGTHVHFMDKDEVIMGGVRFLGATLWTDFRLYGDGPKRDDAYRDAVAMLRDFSRIRSDVAADQHFTPIESEVLFNDYRDWLAAKLDEPYDGPTVVITHHAPSAGSIHPRFKGSSLNNCFVSRLESLMGSDRAVLWIHGHTHDSFDYAVNGTRVICNPRGYVKDGVNENALFNPELLVTVGPKAI